MQKILVLNAGSSSLKYKLYGIKNHHFTLLFQGDIDRLEEKKDAYHDSLKTVEKKLQKEGLIEDFSSLDMAGHRVVHGGEHLITATVIDQDVIDQIRDLIPLAPLHNPANLAGIEALRDHVPSLLQVAVFDTAFHHSMPSYAYRYALPKSLYTQEGIRRFGFHGISHQYLLRVSADFLHKAPHHCNLITIHLGNGASITAIKEGKSEETSMGFTPLEGLVMGTRCGDIDSGILLYLLEQKKIKSDTLAEILNHQSGLKGICGKSDMRDVLALRESGDKDASLAINLFTHRIKSYIGAYIAQLGDVDAIVFAGGIGTHSSIIRQEVCIGLESLGIMIDLAKNNQEIECVTSLGKSQSPISILAMPTDEELEIAHQTYTLFKEKK